MSEFLKGNYKAPKMDAQPEAAPAPGEAPAKAGEFEAKALERLGGSIAFVMKSKTFLWTPDGDKKPDEKKA